jgi:hypothetical protein
VCVYTYIHIYIYTHTYIYIYVTIQSADITLSNNSSAVTGLLCSKTHRQRDTETDRRTDGRTDRQGAMLHKREEKPAKIEDLNVKYFFRNFFTNNYLPHLPPPLFMSVLFTCTELNSEQDTCQEVTQRAVQCNSDFSLSSLFFLLVSGIQYLSTKMNCKSPKQLTPCLFSVFFLTQI